MVLFHEMTYPVSISSLIALRRASSLHPCIHLCPSERHCLNPGAERLGMVMHKECSDRHFVLHDENLFGSAVLIDRTRSTSKKFTFARNETCFVLDIGDDDI